MIAIFGLGNPGPEYSHTRHNIGFQTLDLLSADFKYDKKSNSEISKISISDLEILLVKPHTFMNNSGEAVMKVMQKYKLQSQDCWVIFDEIDLELGKIKIKLKGGPGTHNGMKSIVANIGENFPRFRLGIESRGITAPEQQELSSFVLSKFLKEENIPHTEMLVKTKEALLEAITNGLESAMNKFN